MEGFKRMMFGLAWQYWMRERHQAEWHCQHVLWNILLGARYVQSFLLLRDFATPCRSFKASHSSNNFSKYPVSWLGDGFHQVVYFHPSFMFRCPMAKKHHPSWIARGPGTLQKRTASKPTTVYDPNWSYLYIYREVLDDSTGRYSF